MLTLPALSQVQYVYPLYGPAAHIFGGTVVSASSMEIIVRGKARNGHIKTLHFRVDHDVFRLSFHGAARLYPMAVNT